MNVQLHYFDADIISLTDRVTMRATAASERDERFPNVKHSGADMLCFDIT